MNDRPWSDRDHFWLAAFVLFLVAAPALGVYCVIRLAIAVYRAMQGAI